MDRMGRSQLLYCALEGDVPGIRQRLAAGDSPSAADTAGFTPLHFAAQQSQAQAVAALIEAGALVDAIDKFGNTPLWRAVFNARDDGSSIRALLLAGADPDLPNSAGVSPRSLAETIANQKLSQYFDSAE